MRQRDMRPLIFDIFWRQNVLSQQAKIVLTVYAIQQQTVTQKNFRFAEAQCDWFEWNVREPGFDRRKLMQLILPAQRDVRRD